MKKVMIKDLKKGDLFTVFNYGDNPDPRHVKIRGDYIRSEKKYECVHWDDTNRFADYKGTRYVYTDFVF